MIAKLGESSENQYLPEDQDILNELESIGVLATPQTAEHQKHKVSILQIKATLRSRKTADNFDKSTTRFSIILAAFAMIQIIIALMQFLLDATSATNRWIGFFVIVACSIFIGFVLRSFNKILKDK